jgi:hypothetical protein
MHVRISPKPHQFIELDRSYWSRRVEIETAYYPVPDGIWIECDQKLLDEMSRHIADAEKKGDQMKVDRVSFLHGQCSEHCRD